MFHTKLQMLLFPMLAAIVLSFAAPTTHADVYELRTYTTHEGKLDDLNARFRDHTVKLFEKHGMENVGYWVPIEGPKSKNTLIYVLKHKSRDAAAASWKAFIADPEWKAAAKASTKDGPILAKRPESIYMNATDYSSKFTNSKTSDKSVFELRTYLCNKDKLKLLDARFRDHTLDLFKKHGIQWVGYWHPADKPASQDTLIYILRHESPEAAKASWKAFGSDPAWRKVAKESQKDGRFLRERPEAVYMKATDYSPVK